MFIINPDSYHLLIEPLKQQTINNLFARSVVEQKVTGKVFADNQLNPKTFYVLHPYGMSLLFGDSTNMEFNKKLLDYCLNHGKIRNRHEWMQAYPQNWDEVLKGLFIEELISSDQNTDNTESGIIELNTRLNFRFDKEKYLANKTKSNPENTKIVPTDKHIFEQMKGTVIPSYFWDSATDFINSGVGFSVLSNNQLASTAYSAFIHENKLEIGIETIPEYRGRGYAQLACSALIDYCLKSNYEPVWACRKENTGSQKLANKLGFVISKELPFYRLSK